MKKTKTKKFFGACCIIIASRQLTSARKQTSVDALRFYLPNWSIPTEEDKRRWENTSRGARRMYLRREIWIIEEFLFPRKIEIIRLQHAVAKVALALAFYDLTCTRRFFLLIIQFHHECNECELTNYGVSISPDGDQMEIKRKRSLESSLNFKLAKLLTLLILKLSK